MFLNAIFLLILMVFGACTQEIHLNVSKGKIVSPGPISFTSINRASPSAALEIINGTCPYNGSTVAVQLASINQTTVCSGGAWTLTIDTTALPRADYSVVAETTDPKTLQKISATTTYTRTNISPSLDPIADISVAQNSPITQLNAGDGGNDLDADLEAITYSCFFDTSINGSVANTNACSSLAGVSFNPTSGVMDWTPSSGQLGSYEFKINGSDGSLSDDEFFSIVVSATNQAPVLDAIGDQTIYENTTIATVNAGDGGDDFDSDAQAITYSCYYDVVVNGSVSNSTLCSALPGVSFNTTTGVLNWTPNFTQAGSYEFRITGTDGSLSDDELFVVTVNNLVATKLSFTTEPSTSATAGTVLSTQPYVSFLSSADVLVADETSSVVLQLYTDSSCTVAASTTTYGGDNSLSGTLSVAAVNGVSAFSNVQVNLAGTLYLRAQSGALTTDCSSAMTIAAGAYNLSESQLSVSAATVMSGASVSVTLTARDAFGNPNPTGVGTVTFNSSLVGGTGTFGGTTNLGSGQYSANFTGVLTGSVTLSGLINTAAIADTETITVTPGAPATITIASGNNQVAPAATMLLADHVVTVKDANSNVIPGLTINWSVLSGGGSYTTATSTTNASGNAANRYTTGTNGTNATRATVNATALFVDFTTTGGTPPTISNIADRSSIGTVDVPFTVTDAEETLNCATSVTATSSNISVIAVGAITFSGTAPNCIARLTKDPWQTGASTITFTVSDGSSTAQDSFVVTFTAGWYQEAFIKAPNAESGDSFGVAVSVSGDTIAVAATNEDSNQTTITNGNSASSDNSAVDSGAVYVFKRTGQTWTQEAYIKAPNAEASDCFGCSLSLNGDTLVVGAQNEDSNQTTITNGSTASADNTDSNSGAVYVFKRTGSTWTQEAYLKPSYGTDYFGTSVSVSGDTLVVSTPWERSAQYVITDAPEQTFGLASFSGAAYVFRRTGSTWVQEAYVKAPNAEEDDWMGDYVSVSDDTFAISAGWEDSNQTTISNGPSASDDNSLSDSGAVYVFKRKDAIWTQEAFIKAANASSSLCFGEGVSLSGDTLAVSSSDDDSSQTTITNGSSASADTSAGNSGAVFIYKRSGSSWSQEAYIKAPNAEANDRFGFSVALTGNTLAVSASNESSSQMTITNGSTASSDNSVANAGAVYVYKRTGATWAQEAYIKASNAGLNDYFGTALSSSGDTIVVSSDEDSNQTTITNGSSSSSDNSVANSGAVFVYRNSARLFDPPEFIAKTKGLNSFLMTWQTAGLKATGYKIAYNVGTVAPPNCNSGTVIDVGNAYSYTLNSLTEDTTYSFRICSYDSTLALSDGYTTSFKTGKRVTITTIDDLTTVGSVNVPFTIKAFSSALSCSGSLTALSSDAGVLPVSSISFSGTAPSCVATFTKDPGETGTTTITIIVTDGAYTAQESFNLTFIKGWYQEAYIKASNADAQDQFGKVLSLSGDTLAVGASNEQSNQTTITNGTGASSNNSLLQAGAAYVYKRSGKTWVQEAYLKAPNAEAYDFFGGSISLSGDTIVVGAQAEGSNQTSITNGTTASSNNSAASSGAAYVFQRTGSTWAQQAYLKAPNAQSGDYFGAKVAISGNVIAVGAYCEDSNQATITNGTTASSNNSLSCSGAVYVFRRTGTTWAPEAYIKAPNVQASDYFGGDSLAVSGETIVVGTPQEDSNQTTITNGTSASADNSVTNSGAAYVFRRTGSIWAQEAFIKASNAEANDWYGNAVSVNGDTIVVTATSEDSGQSTITNGTTASADNSATSAGAAYVYRRTGSTWVQEAYVKVSNMEEYDSLGNSVSVSGDTLVLSSAENSRSMIITNGLTTERNNSSSDSGAVYVFKRTGSSWVQEASIKAINSNPSDYFGVSISISGDTIVVGARGEDSNQTTITNGFTANSNNSLSMVGAVYVYRNSARLFDPGEFYATSKSADSLQLNWQKAGLNATGYKIAYNTGTTPPVDCNSGTVIDVGNVLSYNLGSLLENTSYSFRICSYDSGSALSSGYTTTFKTTFRPVISNIADTTSVGSISIPFTISDSDSTLNCSTSVTAASSDTSVIAVGAIAFSGTAPNCVATVTKNPNQVGASTITLTVSDGTSTAQDAFVLTFTTGWYAEAFIKAPNAESNDFFGGASAISGDTLVVGARAEDSAQTTITNGTTASADNSAVDAGAVYVFKRSGSTWAQEAYLKAPNSDVNDFFGSAVAISGDTLVVGASYEDSSQTTITNATSASADNSLTDSGAVYVFKRSGSTWSQESYIKAPNANSSDRFGSSVAINGNTLVAGAINESSNETVITNGSTASADNSSSNSGASYVFTRIGTTWTQEAYIKASNADSGDNFGVTVAMNSDTIAVGTFQESSSQTTITNGTTASSDNSAGLSGAVYLYKRSGTNWTQEAYVKAPNAEANDYFGYDISLSSDTLVVGAPGESSSQTTISNGTTASSNNSAVSSGAVYVFRRSAGVWNQEAYIKASNAQASDNFGSKVSVSGDTVVVSAFNEDSNQTTITNSVTASSDNSASGSGAAYVYKRTGTSWAQEAFLKGANAEAGDKFGSSVSVSGDTIVVGAELENSNQTTITNGHTASTNNSALDSGAMYVFRNSARLFEVGDLSVTSLTSTSVNLRWASAGQNSTGYKVAYQAGTISPVDCSTSVDVGSSLTYVDLGLTPGTTYTFKVCSYDSSTTGNGPSMTVTTP